MSLLWLILLSISHLIQFSKINVTLIFFSVTDGVYFDTSVLNVTIKDVNDNVPYFLNLPYTVDIVETAGYGKMSHCSMVDNFKWMLN